MCMCVYMYVIDARINTEKVQENNWNNMKNTFALRIILH